MSASILLVEDNPFNRLLISELLEPGYQVIEAPNLSEARRALSESVPDLVLLDMNLPDGNGLDLAREIRRDERLRALPVAALTANAMRGDEVAALEAGCDIFLTKPIEVGSFKEAVDRLAAGGEARSGS